MITNLSSSWSTPSPQFNISTTVVAVAGTLIQATWLDLGWIEKFLVILKKKVQPVYPHLLRGQAGDQLVDKVRGDEGMSKMSKMSKIKELRVKRRQAHPKLQEVGGDQSHQTKFVTCSHRGFITTEIWFDCLEQLFTFNSSQFLNSMAYKIKQLNRQRTIQLVPVYHTKQDDSDNKTFMPKSESYPFNWPLNVRPKYKLNSYFKKNFSL